MSDESRARPADAPGQILPITSDDEGWLRDRAGSGSITLKPVDEGDVEGHGMGGATVLLRAFDDDDTEGHAIAVRFPTREDADAFRRRIIVAGALSATIAISAAGVVGVANLSSDQAATGGAAAAGMDWTQAERPGTHVATGGAAAGMDWSQAERPGTHVATGGAAAGMDWTQAERPGANAAAPEGEIGDADLRTGGPQPR